MIINKQNADHYVWGGRCDGWRLMNTPSLSVIHERMPAHSQEVRHYHREAGQFFYVLRGSMSIEIDGVEYRLSNFEGVHVKPGSKHQAFNKSDADVEFLVISQPSTTNDRVTAE